MQPEKDGIERYCTSEAARRTTLPDAPGHDELSPVFSSKFDQCRTVAVNHTQEQTYESGSSVLSSTWNYPGMVDT